MYRLMLTCGLARSLLAFVRFFFFNDTATTEIYTLSLHDALPISGASAAARPATGPTVALLPNPRSDCLPRSCGSRAVCPRLDGVWGCLGEGNVGVRRHFCQDPRGDQMAPRRCAAWRDRPLHLKTALSCHSIAA